MSNISKRRKEGSRTRIKSVGDHKEFLNRITKTLYYGQLPTLPCLSLPVTEVSCSVWSAAARGRSLRRLHADAAAGIARQACVSPCALVLALLYLERLQACNPRYLARAPPQDLFLVSLMVGNKFLQDDGEDDEVICSEWAESGGIEPEQLKNLEMEFLNAIDWKVFVSDESFEAGLAWLEGQVALRQAHWRGFFTYADLAAAGGGAGGAALCAALALASLAGVLALLASALLVSHAWASALQPAAPLAAPLAARLAPAPAPAPFAANGTAERRDGTENAERADGMDAAERPRCCEEWARRLEAAAPGAPPEPRRAVTWGWLYRSSLVDPLQRWLERVNEYAELLARGWGAGRGWSPGRGCERGWADLTRLGALVATVADR